MTNLSVEGRDDVADADKAIRYALGLLRRGNPKPSADLDYIVEDANLWVDRLLARCEQLTQALEEQEASLSRMLDEDGWPIPRLAARLHRLRTLARQALSTSPLKGRDDE